jgi:uncharacterized protein
MKTIRFLFIILITLTTGNAFAQWQVESVPNQKLVDGSYVSNPDAILDETTVAQIDTILTSLEKRTSAQVAVVVLNSIGDADNVDFAQKLFETWGLGQKENNNGLLILFAKEQRVVRFHTGYGVEGVLPDVVCKRIQMQYMVPEFKNENYAAGILAGVQQVDQILSDPNYASEINQLASAAPDEIDDFTGIVIILSILFGTLWLIIFIVKAVNGHFADSKKPSHTDYPEMRLTRWGWLFQYVLIPILIVAAWRFSGLESSAAAGLALISLYLYFMIALVQRLWRTRQVIKRFTKTNDYSHVVDFLRHQQWYWLLMAFLFPPFVIYFIYHLIRKGTYRNHPRDCQQCQQKMVKLNDLAEDEYLTKNMLLEEQIRSVDYDVWKCTGCASIEISHYLSRFSKYTPCPKCKTIAYYLKSDRTIQSASYSSSGKGESIYECKFCGHSKKSTYTIAKLVHTTSSGSGSSFGSSSSSSSSSGGSWGGGSSGGGGSSSSW